MDPVLHVWDAHCHYFSLKQMENRAKRMGITLEELIERWKTTSRRNRPEDREFELPPKDPVDMAKKWLLEMEKYSQNGISIEKITLFSRARSAPRAQLPAGGSRSLGAEASIPGRARNDNLPLGEMRGEVR